MHRDRLDVKVAVRYPKSYGPRGGKGRAGGGDDNDKDEMDQVHNFLVPPTCVFAALSVLGGSCSGVNLSAGEEAKHTLGSTAQTFCSLR